MPSRSFTRSLTDFLGDIGHARHTFATYSRLSRLSDGQLARRGLTRQDIPQAAYRRAGLGDR